MIEPSSHISPEVWHKATYSHAANGCVEVGSAPGVVGVRDSKLGSTSPILTFTRAEWTASTASLRES